MILIIYVYSRHEFGCMYIATSMHVSFNIGVCLVKFFSVKKKQQLDYSLEKRKSIKF